MSDLHTGLTGVERLLRKADIARDQGDPEAAAQIYRTALDLAPDRNDIKVQLGNMLKDTGRLQDAAAIYREAQAADPDDADVCVQMGHVLKLMGQRAAAFELYQRAATLNPNSWAAIEELAEAGESWQQQRRFEANFRAKGADAVMQMSQQLAAMRKTLDEMTAMLPDALAQTAFPVDLYASFRELYAVPPPPDGPRVTLTVLLHADRETLPTLYGQLAAMRDQTYAEWTMKVFGRDAERARVVEIAAEVDPRISWIALDDKAEPSVAEWTAAREAAGEWVVLLAAGALLQPQALAWMAAVPHLAPASAYIVDEDRCEEVRGGLRHIDPVFRQVVDYDTLLEANVYGETIAVSRDAFCAVMPAAPSGPVGRARSRLLLDLARQGKVGHLPHVLVSIFEARGPSLPEHRIAVAEHLARHGLGNRIAIAKGERGPSIWAPRTPTAPLAVVIPTRDNAFELSSFIRSLRDKAEHPDHLRLVIVENGSARPETKALLDELGDKRYVTVIAGERHFNWSRLSNLGARAVEAPYLVFANDDMVMLTENWDARLRGLLDRDDVGAVGVRLLYGDDTLQHAGMLFGWKSRVIHDGVYEPGDSPGPARRFEVTRATGAVTGAFLATRRTRFVEMGGFDEEGLPVAYSDVDYALKLRQAGYKVLWTPGVSMRHYESKTRGMDILSPAKKVRNEAETAVMDARWGTAFERDPSLNPIWYPATLPFRLIAAPSAERVLAHLRRTSDPHPWHVERRQVQPDQRRGLSPEVLPTPSGEGA